jgi:hypothetical protein
MGFTLEALGYEITGKLAVLRIFDKAKVKQGQETMKKAHELAIKLAQSIRE